MFPTAGPLGFPIGTASRMLVVKVDLRLKRSMSASGTFRTSGDDRLESAKRRIADMGQAALASLDFMSTHPNKVPIGP